MRKGGRSQCTGDEAVLEHGMPVAQPGEQIVVGKIGTQVGDQGCADDARRKAQHAGVGALQLPAWIDGQRNDDVEYRDCDHIDQKAGQDDVSGDAPAIELHDQIADNIRQRKDDHTSVNGDTEQIPQLDGSQVG